MENPRLLLGSTTKAWLVVFATIVLVLLAGSYAYYKAEIDSLREDRHRMLVAIGELKAGQIRQWRSKRAGDAWRIAHNPLLAPVVEGLARDPAGLDDPAGRATLHDFLQLERRADGYAEVLLLTPDGRPLLSSNQPAGTMGPVAQTTVSEALAADRAVLSDLYRDATGAIRIDAVAAVDDAGGNKIALVLLRSDPRVDLYPLIQSWPTPSASAETLLVQRQGDKLVFLNDLRHLSGTAMQLHQSLADVEVPAVQAVLGRQGVFEGRDYRGVKVLADLRAVPDSPWFMVAKVDADEIMAEVRSRTTLIVAIVGLLILLTAAATAYLYRRRQAGLFLGLYHAESRERQAQEAFRTTLYSIGDAVITTDVAGRVRQMNPVAERLTGWSEVQARDQPPGEVFRIIDETSRAGLDSPVSEVLRTGHIVELSNHTLLVARDGAEHPIADSAAPIRDGGGQVQGVVLVFSDQSARHAARKALAESEERVRLALAANNLGLFDLHIPTGASAVNDQYAAMLGYEPSGFHETYSSWLERMHPDDRARVVGRYTDYVEGRAAAYDIEFRLRARNGDWKWIHSIGTIAVRDAEGRPLRMIGTHADISERKQLDDVQEFLAQHGYRGSEQDFFQMLAKYLARALEMDYVCIDRILPHRHGARTEAFFFDGEFRANVEYELADAPCGQVVDENVFCHPANVSRLYPRDHVLQDMAAESYIGMALFSSQGQQIGLIAVMGRRQLHDVRLAENLLRLVSSRAAGELERRLAKEALAQSEERVRLALSATNQGLYDLDIQSGQATINSQYASMLGYPAGELRESYRAWIRRLHPDDRKAAVRACTRYLAGDSKEYRAEYRMRTKSGDWKWILSIGSVVTYAADGHPVRMLGTHSDITERKQQQAELEYRASFDELTDLPNRHTMRETLQAALKQAEPRHRPVGAILLNVDRLHHVNDTLGHAVGDQVLVEVARRLRRFAEENSCVVGRIAGDEFLIVTEPRASTVSFESLAQGAKRVLAQDFSVAGSNIFLTSSAGVAWSSGAVTSAAQLIGQSDLAMKRAKTHGSNQVAFYSEALASTIAERMVLSAHLHQALERNELSLHYQPLVDATLGHVAGVEALMRWNNPSLGGVSPVRFIPAAEDTGLIVPLGDWALDTALAQMCRWREQGYRTVPVSVNVSLAQLRHPNFYSKVAMALEQSGADPNLLKLEITESVVMEEPQATVPLLQRMKALGVRIVLDDFGTGYSSLSYLRELPIDEIKIDASFVKDVLKDEYATALCTAIISMSRQLRLVVVAEGVETEAQARFLTQSGCHFLQGFLFSRPLPATSLGVLLDGAQWGLDGHLATAQETIRG